MENKLKVEYVDIDTIKPYKNNAKLHPKEQIEQIKKSIENFGMNDPIGIWNNEIVEGHGRILACKELGYKQIPVIKLDHLTDEERKSYIIAHNKLTMNSDFDIDILRTELENLKELDFDLELTGFNVDELDDIFQVEEEQEIVEDEVPEVPEEPKAKLGDIYQLGSHRLMCGDSTKEEDVSKLMNGVKADMVFTDPPYNMNYCGAGFINEQNKNVKERIKNIIDFDAKKISYLSSQNYANNIFIFTSKDLIKEYLTIFDGWAFNLLMWHKTNTPPMVNNNFFADTEYLLYFHKGKRIWNNGLKPIDIYKKYFVSSMGEGKKEAGDLHPTMKPLSLISNEIKICSQENGVVLDLFGGSGSTLIACEQLNRKCYMMELDPKYIDVIIKRWEEFTGKKAIKLN